MKRREFLRKGLALGAAGLVPNIGLSASESFPLAVNEPLASMAMDTELVPISKQFRRIIRLLEREHNLLVAGGVKVEVIEKVKQITRQIKAKFEELDAQRASAT